MLYKLPFTFPADTQVHILGASLIGIISALAMHHLRKNKSPKVDNHMIIINQLSPILDATESGRAGGRLERFSHYVGELFIKLRNHFELYLQLI